MGEILIVSEQDTGVCGVRCYITGLGPDGESTVMRTVDIDPVGVTALWRQDEASGGRASSSEDPPRDIGLPPGEPRSFAVYFPPGSGVPANATHAPSLHWTRSTDLDFIISGQMELILETMSVTLEPGDSVVLPGVMHNWKAGPEGCLMLVSLVGSE